MAGGFITAKALKQAAINGKKRIRPFCVQRKEFIQTFRGRFYGDNDSPRQPINLVNRQMTILAAHLTAGHPLNDVRTDRLEFRAKALLQQLALRRFDEEIDRARISRRMLMESFVSPCLFARVGLRAGAELVTIDGHDFDRGQPYYLPISLDDMLYDPVARCDEESLFMGHTYRINRQRAIDSGVFRGYEDLIRRLPTIDQRKDPERTSEETTPDSGDPDSYPAGPVIELADLAIYDDDMVYMATIPWGEDTPDEYLHLDLWGGPERGPFVKREYTPGIDSPFGVPPVAQAREQAELANDSLNKLTEQINALKAIICYKPGYEDDAKRAKDAKDGDRIALEDPKNDLDVKKFDTVTPGLSEFIGMVLGLWSQQTGGIQVLGGDNAGADSATEYAGVSSTAQLLVGDIAREHERFETEVTKRIAFFLRNDPFIDLPMIHRLPGGEMIQVRYSPEVMEDDHGDFTYKVRALSMRAETQDPIIRQRRLVELMAAFGQIAQVSAATGNLIDFAGSVRVFAREFGIEEIDEIVGDPGMAALERALYQNVPGEMMGQAAGPFGGLRPQGMGRATPIRAGRGRQSQQTSVGSLLAGSMNAAVRNPAA